MIENTRNWVSLPFQTRDLRENINICGSCPLASKLPITFVPFEIVGSNPRPDVLFVAEAPFRDEMKQQRPLIGKAGSFLRDVISQYIDSYALANVVCCHPTDTRKVGIRTPTTEEQGYCVAHVTSFIEEIQPKVIVLLGQIAYMNILPKQYVESVEVDIKYVGKMQKKSPISMEGITYACSYHPSYIARSGGFKSRQYPIFNSRIKSILKVLNKETEPIEIPEDDLTITFHKLDKLPEVLIELEDYKEIGLDYEAKTLEPWFIENKPTGFSLSCITGPTSGKSYYIIVDRDPTETEKSLLLDFFHRKSPWTYNAKYETNLTWAWLGECVKFNDTWALCKIDCSPGSLKFNAQKYLGAELWEEEVYSIVEYFEFIFGQMKKQQNVHPEIVDLLKKGKKKAACVAIQGDEKILSKFKKLLSASDALLEIINERDFTSGLRQYPYAWAAVPPDILGEYCCWDSYLTLRLKHFFWEKYSKYYPYYISQTWLAGNMEAYGYNWDDETATTLNKFYIEEAITCLYEIINRVDLDDEARLKAEQIVYDPEFDGSPNDKLSKLKEVFNPLSNLPEKQDVFWRVYRTPFTETLAFLRYIYLEISQSDILDDDSFLPCIKKAENPENTLVALMEKAAEKGKKKYINEVERILEGLERNLDWWFRRFAIDILEFHYEAHVKYGGVDVDDQSTWNEPFYLLYYLKRFKKVLKSDSTYIWGKVGRTSVWLSEIDDISVPPRRIANYYNLPKNYTLKPNQRWIFNANFFENGADTKRWRAGIHTVPANSELREIYTPRTPTSILLHVDYAQNEVRFMAKMAGEETLLEAFDEGLDVHTFVASKIFKKNMGDVSSQERKFAKSATFGLLYGKGVESFATDMMGGDLEGAKAFFKEFFAALPRVEKYILDHHKMIKELGYVSTIFGDPIYIDTEFYRNDEVERRSQNYPIQCFLKDTKIKMLDGTTPTIEELSKRRCLFWVYSFDICKNECVPALATKAWESGKTHKMIRITLDNGEIVETTNFHLFMLKDASYRSADELKIEDSLMSLRGEIRVVKSEVVEYNEEIPVYDMEVPSYRNFGLSPGIIVHNSSASSLGAHAACILNEITQKRGLKAVPLGFTHDAVDFDVEIADLFSFIPLMHEVLVGFVRKRFQIPVEIDWEIGVHQNHMMELTPKGGGSYHFECPKTTLPKIIDRMRTHFDVSYEIDKIEEDCESLGELFKPKRAFSRYLGETIPTCKGNLRLSEKL